MCRHFSVNRHCSEKLKGRKITGWFYFYRPQRSCGQGNVFTGVCLSTMGEGVCLSACWDAIPPLDGGTPPGTRQTSHPRPWIENLPPPRTRQTPLDGEPPPGPGRPPPGKQTPAYGLQAAGTHPTGMHSCYFIFYLFPRYERKQN